MRYSFFGTCFKDHALCYGALKSIRKQTILPNEIVLVDSSWSESFQRKFEGLFADMSVKIIYVDAKCSRVEALNISLKYINGIYSMRFDARSRFCEDYAERALDLLGNGYSLVGGSPTCVTREDATTMKTMVSLMDRAYIFGYPRHRLSNYDGPSGSVYLGCFNTAILKEIRYRSSVALISEDSQICRDFIARKHLPYISSKIRVYYLQREDRISLYRLFFTYGRSRGNTLLSANAVHRPFLFVLLVFLSTFLIILLSLFNAPLYLIVILLYTYNILGEIFYSRQFNHRTFMLSLFAVSLQMAWLLGLICSLLFFKHSSSLQSNYIQ